MVLYERMSGHVKQQDITKEQFIPGNPLFVTSDEIKAAFHGIGLPVSDEDVDSVMIDNHAKAANYLSME